MIRTEVEYWQRSTHRLNAHDIKYLEYCVFVQEQVLSAGLANGVEAGWKLLGSVTADKLAIYLYRQGISDDQCGGGERCVTTGSALRKTLRLATPYCLLPLYLSWWSQLCTFSNREVLSITGRSPNRVVGSSVSKLNNACCVGPTIINIGLRAIEHS